MGLYTSVSKDVTKSLVINRLYHETPYSKMHIWQNQDYISLLFPNTNMSSQNISNYLNDLGSDNVRLNFLYHHIRYIKDTYNLKKVCVSIGSSPCDNQCELYIIQILYS